VEDCRNFGYKFLYFGADACVIQRRYQFRLLDMCESATQRTLHQIIVYHGCPPRGFIALFTSQLDDQPASEAVITVSCTRDGNHTNCTITEAGPGPQAGNALGNEPPLAAGARCRITLVFWSAFGDKRFQKRFQVCSRGTLLELAVGMERLLSWLYA
jgi:hypothetical protein